MVWMLSVAAPLSAAPGARLVDPNGKPVAGARVAAVFADGTAAELRSDAVARVEIPGDATAEAVVTLAAGRLADSVTVTASRTELPISRSIPSTIVLSA